MKYKILIMSALILALSSCAKEKAVNSNEDSMRYLEAWIAKHHPTAVKTPLGAYILSETPGTGASPGDSIFVRINYSSYTLNGDLTATTYEKLSRQAGTYDKTAWYGPIVAYRGEQTENLAAGVEEALSSMRLGGRKTVLVPGWLTESERYDTPEEYFKKCSGADIIYEFELVSAFNNEEKWERDSLKRFIDANYPGATEDEDMPGFYYIRTKAGNSDREFPADTTIYINYTGRLLNDRVFDTTVKDTAKVWGLYSADKTYQQIKISWHSPTEDYSGIKMGDNNTDTIPGFAYGLSKMHPGEAGICFFTSNYGYSAAGSGSSIPGYSPLCFELETTIAP